MEADAKGQSDAEGMLSTIGLEVAAIVEEVLQAGLYVEAEVGGEVVLQTQTERRWELPGNTQGGLTMVSTDTVGDVVDIRDATNRHLQHEPCWGVETEVGLAVPLPA